MYKMGSLILVLIISTVITPHAAAVQLDVDIVNDTIEPEFRFLRVVTIEHLEGGQIARLLGQVDTEISFRLDSKNSDGDNVGDVSTIISLLNKNLRENFSTALVNDLVIQYKAMISPSPTSTIIEYKIDLIPTISGITRSDYVDFQWRGFNIVEPVMVQTVYGEYDMNNPGYVLKILAPKVYQELGQQSSTSEILSIPLLDASGLSVPLTDWHFLFDPIGKLISEMSIDTVISQYSLGECKITDIQICQDKLWMAEIQLDQKYTISAIESKDDATVTLLGYTKISSIQGIEYVERIIEAEDRPSEDLSVMMMYGMAIIALVAGGSFFIISNKKIKNEHGMGQTGVDPTNLIAYPTSAGVYQTNRGESVLRQNSKKSAV